MQSGQSIPLFDGDCVLYRDFYDAAKATTLLDRLTRETTWEQPIISMFGRNIPSPRLAAWYGDTNAVYKYSGIINQPLPWTDTLLMLRQDLEKHCRTTFNSVLLNMYRDEQDSMGWHSDNERELGDLPVIASVSFGATRRFRFQHRTRKDAEKVSLNLEHGSLLVMAGATQLNWKHSVPKERKATGPRINLTFREIV